jgi:hypothetical protein
MYLYKVVCMICAFGLGGVGPCYINTALHGNCIRGVNGAVWC